MYKKITFLSLFISILGIIYQFVFNSFSQSLNVNYSFVVKAFYGILPFLDSVNLNISTNHEVFWIEGFYWGLFFSFLMLVGSVSFYKSKGKEIRLLRFLFSILFVQHSIYFLIYVFNIISISIKFGFGGFYWHNLLIIVKGFLLYFLFKCMIYLNKTRELDFETFIYTESTEISYFKTNNWQRLFHLILDSFIFGMITYQLLDVLVRIPQFAAFFNEVENLFNSKTSLALFICIFRTIFYFTFEALFDASPAKFLTESRVVDDEGLKNNVGAIFKRSLSRNIPLDSVSFLFNADWHDTFSNTQVCKEKRTGINGAFYFLLIPIFAILCYSAVTWKNIRQRNRYWEAEHVEFNENKADILQQLKTLDTSSVLKLKNEGYSSTMLYLKVENITNGQVEFSIISLYDNPNDNHSYIEKVYLESKDTLDRIKIKNTDLRKLVVSQFDEIENGDYVEKREIFEGIATLPNNLQGHYIENIFKLKYPQLSVGSITQRNENISVELKNIGLPGEIIAIESEDKKLEFKKTNQFPILLKRNDSKTINIEGENIDNYKFKIIFKDSLNRKLTYKVSSKLYLNDGVVRLIK